MSKFYLRGLSIKTHGGKSSVSLANWTYPGVIEYVFRIAYYNSNFTKNFDSLTTRETLIRHKFWGLHSPYAKVVIIRGVGYKFFVAKNDLANNNLNTFDSHSLSYFEDSGLGEENLLNFPNINSYDFDSLRYLIVRAGHTKDLYQPIPRDISLKTSKKDRKLVIYGPNKSMVSQFLINIFNYRQPSVYTGRGIRRKHIKPIRKAGKKDKQKGRF